MNSADANARSLLSGPAPVLLPADHPDVAARELLAGGTEVRDAVRGEPASSYLWALLAEEALDASADDEVDPVAAYAYARTGYHRGLDALRRAGWRGQGLIPADHVPNQGFLRAVLALAEAADAIGEVAEAERCRSLLIDSGTTVQAVTALR